VAGGINPVDGVVFDIGVAVQTLGVAGLWDDAVGRQEAAQDGIIVAGVVEVQAGFGVLLLAGEAALEEVYGAGVAVGLPEGLVGDPLDLGPIRIGEDVEAAQVIAVEKACPELVEG
jgi:hypothetical protein